MHPGTIVGARLLTMLLVRNGKVSIEKRRIPPIVRKTYQQKGKGINRKEKGGIGLVYAFPPPSMSRFAAEINTFVG